MRVTFTLEGPGDDGETGPVTVGWMLTRNTGGILFDPPTRLRSPPAGGLPVKSAARCPAVLNLESRMFEVACPYDLSLGFQRDADGSPEIVNLLGEGSPVRIGKLAELIELTAESEWRHPDRPIFQLRLPYLFLADEAVYLNQLPAFAHYRTEALPGLMIGGRFPVHIWPRPLMWAFEWHDIEAPVSLRRGEPLFYAQFETLPQERPVRLVEASRTEDVAAYLDQLSGVVNFVSQTFSLFSAAQARRPKRLVVPVDRPE